MKMKQFLIRCVWFHNETERHIILAKDEDEAERVAFAAFPDLSYVDIKLIELG